jgi:hypothetical protein
MYAVDARSQSKHAASTLLTIMSALIALTHLWSLQQQTGSWMLRMPMSSEQSSSSNLSSPVSSTHRSLLHTSTTMRSSWIWSESCRHPIDPGMYLDFEHSYCVLHTCDIITPTISSVLSYLNSGRCLINIDIAIYLAHDWSFVNKSYLHHRLLEQQMQVPPLAFFVGSPRIPRKVLACKFYLLSLLGFR